MVNSPKHCLLVVDDEPNLVQSVQDLLRYDFRVLGTTRASEGLRLAQQEQVHIVMTDQRMPEMSGVDFLRHLRESRPDTVRLLFTAFADIEAVIDAINEGNVFRYITKPWKPQELRTVLKQAEDFYELQAERKRLIQELETANRELRQANDLKRAFIRVASHELRTPLSIVLGLSEMGKDHDEVQAPARRWLQQIHHASERLNERVDQMFKLLLAERFERPLRKECVDLPELLCASANAVQSFIELRKQHFHLELAPSLGTIPAERDKIHDSVVQVLMNAIKFTPDSGTIRLAAQRNPDNEVEILVADTGVGIEPECLPQIFEPFFTRFDVSKHASGTFEFDRRGFGLGLSVVKAFIEMHGGRVKVQSALGKGTQVLITLPGE